MLLAYWKNFAGCYLLILIILIFCSYYAYYLNSKREADDPEKKDYPCYSPWITPITIPLAGLGYLVFLILTSVLAFLFLIIFPLCLLFIRKPFIIKWLLEQAQKIGNSILWINTEILKALGLYRTFGS